MGILHTVLNKLFPPQAEPLSEIRPGDSALVRGRVVARDSLVSPLTGDRCVYYQYTVEQWRASKVVGIAGDGFWEIQETDEAIAEFYIQDGNERAIIAPQRALIEPARGLRSVRVPMNMASQRATQLIIAPDDVVQVTGMAQQARDLHDEERAYRAPVQRIIIVAPPKRQLRIQLIKRAPRS